MNNIDNIMSLIDWTNNPSEQSDGIKLAEKEKDIAPFIQPCTEYYSKNVWDNCAIILSKRSDAELSPYLSDLFAWLQDMNWPGAFSILNRLQKYKNVDTFKINNYRC